MDDLTYDIDIRICLTDVAYKVLCPFQCQFWKFSRGEPPWPRWV